MRLDLRPIGYVIGILLTLLGVTMLVPMAVDFSEGRGFVGVFAESALITILTGSFLAIACSNGKAEGLDIQKTILLTTSVWIALPLFGSIPFIIGSTQLSFVDALFEAVSGVTTTGSTVLSGLESLPKGILLWRGILQWLGGIGIIVVAMVFLPELRVGGMQIFRAEAFDTMGKILPRATHYFFTNICDLPRNYDCLCIILCRGRSDCLRCNSACLHDSFNWWLFKLR